MAVKPYLHVRCVHNIYYLRLLVGARFFDAQLFLVREAQNAFDRIQMALGVFLVGQKVVDCALEKLQRHLGIDFALRLLRVDQAPVHGLFWKYILFIYWSLYIDARRIYIYTKDTRYMFND